MRVVEVSRHGGPEVLTLTEREPAPVPAGHARIQVVEVAPDCGGVEVGQRLAWQGVPGAYAEQALAPSAQLIPVPDNVSDQHAAALPVHGLTAHYLATSSFPRPTRQHRRGSTPEPAGWVCC